MENKMDLKDEEIVVSTFLKFSKIEYLEDFRRGKLYMNNLNYFKTCEKSEEIKDEDEGIKIFFPKGNFEISFTPYNSGKVFKTTPISDGVIRTNEYNDINIFCMYTIYEKHLSNDFKFTISEKIKKDKNYDHYLFITKPAEFIKRINCSIEKISHTYFHQRPVEYVNKKEHYGEMGLFKKFDNYEHQNEFRIAIQVPKEMKDENNAFRLDIGDISDISIIRKTENIEKEWTITPLKCLDSDNSNVDKQTKNANKI